LVQHGMTHPDVALHNFLQVRNDLSGLVSDCGICAITLVTEKSGQHSNTRGACSAAEA